MRAQFGYLLVRTNAGGRSAPVRYRLAPDAPTYVGRSRDCEMCVDDDPTVSRVHCAIKCGDDGVWYVRDSESQNGTFLNNVAVSGETPFRPGDTLSLGKAGPSFTLEQAGMKPSTPSAVTSPQGVPGGVIAGRGAGGGGGRFVSQILPVMSSNPSRLLTPAYVIPALALAGVALALWYVDGQIEGVIN